MISYDERVQKWKEQERKKYLNLEPRLKKFIIPKIVKLYIDSSVYELLDEEVPEYRAYGMGHKAGGLKRSIRVRFSRLSKEMDKQGIKPMSIGHDRHTIFMYLQEKYKDQVWKVYEKEFQKRFGYKPKRR